MFTFTTAILLAAGKGVRFKSRIAKPLIKLGSRPLIVYSLEALSSHPYIKEIIVVVNAGNEKEITKILKIYNVKKISRIVKGGLRRQDSLENALKFTHSRSKLILIHDAARPFINRKIISDTIKAAHKNSASACAVPVKATIKIAYGIGHSAYSKNKETIGIFVKKTLDRSKLWEIQTPQVFNKDLLVEAYKRFGKKSVTDDASLVEKLEKKVRLVMGSYFNIKITTPEDMFFARTIIKKKWNTE